MQHCCWERGEELQLTIKIQLPTSVLPFTVARDHYKNKTGIIVNPLHVAACIAEFALNANDKHIRHFI